MTRRLTSFFLLLSWLPLSLWPFPLHASEEPAARIKAREALTVPAADATASHGLQLTLLNIGGWAPSTIAGIAQQGSRLLMQCHIATTSLELLQIETDDFHQDFETARSRRLAARLNPPRPAVFFVRDTRQRPAFDAEAIGRGNSRSRPELRDTVWITRDTRDAAIAFAHELVHVLMNSGHHDESPGNLMNSETHPHNTQLTPAQCAQIRDNGARHSLLQLLQPLQPRRP
jgi:hypothetical protein